LLTKVALVLGLWSSRPSSACLCRVELSYPSFTHMFRIYIHNQLFSVMMSETQSGDRDGEQHGKLA
jgi:hypothetical protein